MLKKILYALMVVVIVTGAVYSYKKVEFGRKTGMMFQIVFGDANNMGGPGGRPPMGENMEGRQPPGFGPGGERGQAPSREGGFPGRGQMEGNMEGMQRPDFPQGGERGEGPPQGMGRGPGGIISLRDVIPYTFILAFFVLITRVIEVFIKRMFYSRPSS